jgi:hypothetical protein
MCSFLTDTISSLALKSTMFGVLKNTCGQSYNYFIGYERIEFLGPRDIQHDVIENTEYIISLGEQRNETGQCSYSLYLYKAQPKLDPTLIPSLRSYLSSSEKRTNAWAIGFALVFIAIMSTFCMYDKYVKMRNAKVLAVATRGERILATLFPKQVRERMFAEEEKAAAVGTAMQSDLQLPEQLYHAPKSYLKTILASGTLLDKRKRLNGVGSDTSGNDGEMTCDEIEQIMYKSKPIADLFPETTILFAGTCIFACGSYFTIEFLISFNCVAIHNFASKNTINRHSWIYCLVVSP